MIGVTARSDADYFVSTACTEHAVPGRTRSPAEYYAEGAEHGEPAGQWMILGANPLGLSGEVDPDDLRALVNDLRDPATGAPLGKRPYRYTTPGERVDALQARTPDLTPEEASAARVNAQRQSRQANHAWDITFSAPKSWSVLHFGLEQAGRHEEAAAVWDALTVGIEAAMEVAARDLAYTRDQTGAPRVAGRATARYVHNPNWTAAVFRHHTSRDQDPQLHAHVCLVNRVLDEATGRWKTLYSPALTKSKKALDAVFLTTAQAELTRTTGFTFAATPDGANREVRGVDGDVRDLFSTRSRAVTAGAGRLIDEYREKYGREPGKFVRYQINQFVTLKTRQAKEASPPARGEMLTRWEARLTEAIAGGLGRVLAQADASRADGRGDGAGGAGLTEADAARVVAQAVADLDETKSTFTRADLYHAVANRLPDRLDHLDTPDVVALLDGLVDRAAAGRDVVSLIPPAMVDPPAELLDERGRFVFDAPEAVRYSTRANLAREDSLLARLAHVGGRPAGEAEAEAALVGAGLGDDQHRAAMGILTSAQRVHLVVGPAGVGKSRLMAALDGASARLNGAGLTGLATAENAAQVLRGEGIGRAFNIARFLNYHRREAEGRVSARERAEFTIPAGSPVVLDEAGAVSTRDLYEVMSVLDTIGAGKVIIVGDREQVDAVDNAGGFAMMCDAGDPHVLDTVRRFRNDWERDASAALRSGDADAVHQYDTRGRVHGGTPEEMRQAAVSGFVTDTLDGLDSVIVVASTREADRINSEVRERLVQAGRVTEDGVPIRGGTLLAGVGDRVQTRQNERELRDGTTGAVFSVFNRETWTVTAAHDDGSLTLSRHGTDRHVPADYVAAHCDLSYSGTVESVQGRSTDTGHLLAGQAMGRSRLYPGMTRGREANHVYLDVTDEQTAVGRLVDAVEQDDHKPAARTVVAEEMDRAENLGNLGAQWSMLVTEDRAAEHRDMLRAELGADGDAVLADRASNGLFRILRVAESHGRDARETLRAALAAGSLKTARSPAQVLYSRVEKDLDQAPVTARRQADSYVDRTPGGDDPKRVYAREVAAVMDQRVTALGMRAAEDSPAWGASLGAVPDDPAEREVWIGKAGRVAAYREQYGAGDDVRPIGTQPAKTEPERRWAWDRAADALGVDPAQRDIEAKSDGALLNRVEQWQREQQWMPANVDDRLRTAHLARDEARRQAVERADTVTAERAERARERVEVLEAVAAARARAVDETWQARDDARAADRELSRRHPDRAVSAPEPAPVSEPEEVDENQRDRADLTRAQAAMTELSRREADRARPREDTRDRTRGEALEVGD